MSGYAYLDASAIVKLVVAEPETAALERDLANRQALVCSRLGGTEVLRAARRSGQRRLLSHAEDALDSFVFLDITPAILKRAAALDSPGLRTLDAIHLATALGLEQADLHFVTYDARLAAAARTYGLDTVAPGSRL